MYIVLCSHDFQTVTVKVSEEEQKPADTVDMPPKKKKFMIICEITCFNLYGC